MALQDKAMLVDLSFKSWGGYKIDKKVSSEVAENYGSDATMGHYSKQLVPREAFTKLYSVGRSAINDYKILTLPWLDSGWRILSSGNYFRFAEKRREHEQNWNEAVEEFVAKYPGYMQEAEHRLNGLFKPDEYPNPNSIRNRFTIQYSLSPMPAAEDFRVQLGEDEENLIRQNIQETQKVALQIAANDIATRVERIVSHMVERLEAFGKDEGRFRDSLVNNVFELAELIPALNVMDDPKLNEIAENMRKQLCAYTPQELRDVPTSRESTIKSAKEVLDKLNDYFAA